MTKKGPLQCCTRKINLDKKTCCTQPLGMNTFNLHTGMRLLQCDLDRPALTRGLRVDSSLTTRILVLSDFALNSISKTLVRYLVAVFSCRMYSQWSSSSYGKGVTQSTTMSRHRRRKGVVGVLNLATTAITMIDRCKYHLVSH